MRRVINCPVCQRFFATARKNLARSSIKDLAHHLRMAHNHPLESAMQAAETVVTQALEVKSSGAQFE